MAYGTDIDALSPDHRWILSANSSDSVGTLTGTDTSITYTGSAICEDATNCAGTNADGDAIAFATNADITTPTNNIFWCGWFMASVIQQPPVRIIGDGNGTQCMQIVMGFGNILTFEVDDASDTLQIYSDVPLEANRAYHLGIGFNSSNELIAYLDGVEQTESADVTASGSLTARTVGLRMGGSTGTADFAIGGTAIKVVSTKDGSYNQWATWNGSLPTATEIREELFEKGALPDETISTGTESAMQTSLNAYNSSTRSDAPLCIRINDVTGSGNLALTATNMIFDDLASIHIQWMGAGTLTWTNTGTSNASIGSTPNSGTIVFKNRTTVKVSVKDAGTLGVVQGARLILEADTGGDLALGTDILTGTTDVDGEIETTFDYTSDQPYTVKVRKGTSTTYYKTATNAGTITEDGLDVVLLMERDE